ncbi:unnamed protein product [Euphydryas editha]|uniref:Uncharacterized protein n=1 Tax=Euphydryas editha TaxID=104508 RepID=A0AAU9URJ0_EUPED|nr:unnamed protein product [Euphydryas editha]
MATNYLVNVPKQKGRENYNEWTFAAENFLNLEDKLYYIKLSQTIKFYPYYCEMSSLVEKYTLEVPFNCQIKNYSNEVEDTIVSECKTDSTEKNILETQQLLFTERN